jgi:hypothetical protein
MMTHVYQWTIQNPFVWGIVCTLLATVLGFVLSPAKFIKFGFTASQFIRRFFGAKVEKEFEDAIDAFDQGLHSDNKL